MSGTPLPSPHPVFGRKPGRWTRMFQGADDAYWPTEEDVQLFQQHMELVREGKTLFDPLLSVWLEAPPIEWQRRQHVLSVVRYYERERRSGQPDWWEALA